MLQQSLWCKKLSNLLRCQRAIKRAGVNVHRPLLLAPKKKKALCPLPEMTSNVWPLISFDPGLQEDDCYVLLGMGIRAELSRSCRKQQDYGYY